MVEKLPPSKKEKSAVEAGKMFNVSEKYVRKDISSTSFFIKENHIFILFLQKT